MAQNNLCIAGLMLLRFFVSVSPLAAQGGREALNNGVYFGLGVGAGNAWVDCSRCGELQSDSWEGGFTPLTLTIDLGWSVRPDLLLGAELDMWSQSEYSSLPETRGLDLTYLGAVIQYYPLARSRLYVKAGFGLGRLSMYEGPDEILNNGGAILAGVGYDVGVKRPMSITPYIHAIQWQIKGGAGQIRNVAMQSPRNPFLLHAGLAFRYY